MNDFRRLAPKVRDTKKAPRRFATGRNAFTLIELLVAISIIGILAALALGGMWRAQLQARIANTKTLVAKLDYRVKSAVDSYRTGNRRLPINPQQILNAPTTTQGLNALAWCNQLWVQRGSIATDSLGLTSTSPGYPSAMQLAAVNLAALRELQKYEMPDDWYDVVDFSSGPPYGPAKLFVLPTVPGTALMYLAKLNAAASVPGVTQAQLIDNGPAELLYLIVTMGPGQTEYGDEFDLRHVGDIDGDGLLEFHDGWLPTQPLNFYATTAPQTAGMNKTNPIFWIRWPAGYVENPTAGLVGLDPSPLYPPPVPGEPLPSAAAITLSEANHDPYDPFKLDIPQSQTGPARGFALKPLVYSSGPDGSRGLNVVGAQNTIDPYKANGTGVLKGAPLDTTWTDNVTNRLFSGRVQ